MVVTSAFGLLGGAARAPRRSSLSRPPGSARHTVRTAADREGTSAALPQREACAEVCTGRPGNRGTGPWYGKRPAAGPPARPLWCRSTARGARHRPGDGPRPYPGRHDDPEDTPLLELAGLAAYVRLGLFGLVGAHTVGAPDLDAAHRMMTVAVRVGEQQQELLAIGASRGVEPVELMRPFVGVLDSFEARTHESTWWEGLLKGVVGHGVSTDLCRLLATGLPAADASVVTAALAYEVDEPERVTSVVRAATDADPRLASRLALWGRRVVGESLSLCQELLATRPGLAELARRAAAASAGDGEPPADAVAWAMGELTAEHTRRMDRMGLAA
ncbi:ferritin-like fold-containing protein [Xylanimonas protaetiae]|nr:ferritin-like fold-containing protein [Xylanimonas protaetiae]